MTVYTFQPSLQNVFQFQPLLDGETYTASILWNVFRQGYYIQLVDQNGNVIFLLPLVGSSTGIDIQSATWDQNTGLVTVTAALPHGLPLNSAVNVTVSGMTPDAYNGDVLAYVQNRTQFTYPISADPGPVTTLGVVRVDLSLTAGYFSSKMVYRPSIQQIEVTP